MALFMDAHTIEGGVAVSDVAAAHPTRGEPGTVCAGEMVLHAPPGRMVGERR